MEFVTFTFELLEKEHLQTIREIGRQLGVKAPTAVKSKQKLIQDIIDVQSGKVLPVPESKRGAPPKMRPDLSRFYRDEDNFYYGFDETHKSKGLTFNDSSIIVEGILEIHKEGYGFLRAKNFTGGKEDAFVPAQVIKRFSLRRGDKVKGVAKPNPDKDAPMLKEVTRINDLEPDPTYERPDFEKFVACYPQTRLTLADGNQKTSNRIIDLFAPIGMGQRSLIVAPPKTGKTTLIKEIASAIERNFYMTQVFVLLVDERPEEVTELRRALRSDVIYSTFDEGEERHVRVTELVFNRAKRMAEQGYNVVILMDSLTRLARAYNTVGESSGKTLSGGVDPFALQGAKRIFGSARNLEEGGSLTIISTALVETESRMDEVIFEEFKGRGNMEIRLSRDLAEKRVFPAIDVNKSGTRKEELLLSEQELEASRKLRRFLANRKDATEILIEMMERTKDNAELIEKVDQFIEEYQK